MKHRWLLKPTGNTETIETLSRELNVETQIAQLLVQRGINTFEEARVFFRPELSDLHDPFLMKDMDKAVERLLTAISNNEKILIYGDYDVDGTTAVAIIYNFLIRKYSNIEYYIPDRYQEGYGISFKGIDYAEEINCKLVIAVDCGIKAVEKTNYANEKNIDLIICDHHTPGPELPKACAVLDPKQGDCNYPYK